VRFVTILMIILLEYDQVRSLSLGCRQVQFNDCLRLACSGNSTAHRVSLGSSELTQSERFPLH
jgi:hypothetical protein